MGLSLVATAACTALHEAAFAAFGQRGGGTSSRGRALRVYVRDTEMEQLTGVLAGVQQIEKYPRLPVWPAWFGIIYALLDLVTQNSKWAAKLEEKFGGRVCPMAWSDDVVGRDPFLLVAHHRHSFYGLDPLRYIFRSILLPEGFPSHPHRGFETVTYVLRGGLVHRDSFGVKKSYGAPPDSEGDGDGAAVQWMTTGSGMQHEEMWRTGEDLENTEQELFQIWVNLPKKHKFVRPHMQMLGVPSGSFAAVSDNSGLLPVKELGPVPKATLEGGVTVRVIAGEAHGVKSPMETYSNLAIFHVTLRRGKSWSWPRPEGWNTMIYARKGEMAVCNVELPVLHTALLKPGKASGDDIVVRNFGEEPADFLVLAGEPLNEPVAFGSNVVMNYGAELDQADFDLQRGVFGPSWRHRLSDEEWREKVAEHWSNL